MDIHSLKCPHQQQPNNHNPQPTTHNPQPTTTTQHTTHNTQHTTHNNQHTTHNTQQPTHNNQQPTTNNQQPTTNNQQPTTNSNNSNPTWRGSVFAGVDTGAESCMPSPKYVAQSNPSYPALCCQDTTSPWSTDYGGNS